MHFMTQMNSRATRLDVFWLFMIGCFSMTQLKLGAKIGIAELFMVLAAPVLYFKNLRYYRADGMLPMLNLLFLWIIGALFSDWYNEAEMMQFMRGFSVPTTIFASVVCIHNFLRKDIRNYKWIVFGMACSHVISIFVFQRGTAGDLAAEGDMAGAIEAVVGYKLFWANLIHRWILLPVQIAYLKMPIVLSISSLMVASVAAAMSGGRSAFLVSVMSLLLVLYSRRNARLMQSIRRHIVLMMCLFAILGVCVKSAYKYAATHGMLSETDVRKFERQTAQGDSALKLLMSGRGEFFIGFIAALDRPIIGHGSWPLDKYGYAVDFLQKYGDDEDVKSIKRNREQYGASFIPSHSHIVCYWLWHGIFALLFWCYIIFLAIRTFVKYLHIMPEMFGYLVIVLPDFFWHVFFSPFGLRIEECALFAIMVLLHKIAKNNRGFEAMGMR